MWTLRLARAVTFVAAAAVCFGGGRAAPAQETTRPPSEQPASQPIVQVCVVSQQGRVLSENPKGLSLSLGQPLDAESVRTSLRQLYRTGDYADLRAETAPVP